MHLLSNIESLKARSAKLKLVARGIANTLKRGSFKSNTRGQGIEFNGVREYLIGDDVRSIDWNVTARMGKPFVKMFDEDKELVVFFVIDRSSSMETGSQKRTRLNVASEMAALLTLAAEHNNSPVGAVFFDGGIEYSFKPKSTHDNAMLIFTKLDSPPENKTNGTELSKALKTTLKVLKRRSLVFVISDFRTSGYESSLSRLANQHDVVAVCCTDRTDSELPKAGCLSFYDVETREKRLFPTTLSQFKRVWRKTNEERLEKWKNICVKRGVTPVTLSTSEDPALVLEKFFSSRVSK